MHTKLAKIAFAIILCCLITLVVGAETSNPAKFVNPAAVSLNPNDGAP